MTLQVVARYITLFGLGLVLGVLLFSIAYWRGIREGRRRANREKEKELEAFADQLRKAVAPVEEAKGEQKGP